MATVADIRCNPVFLEDLFAAGAEQVRINSAHVSPGDFARMVEIIRMVRPQTPILMDTKGPEIRTTALHGGISAIEVSRGDIFTITPTPDAPTRPGVIGLTFHAPGVFSPGQHLLIDDATLEFEVTAVDPDGTAIVKALTDGSLGSRKSVNIPGADISALPAVTERDAANLAMAASLGIDMVAHSFVRNASDVGHVRALLDAAGGRAVRLFAKIECESALNHFSEILDAADGILVARGDLGMEVKPELIPALQEAIIRRARLAGKPVIVATQFLNSMFNAPHPTRADIADIAQATRQGADTLLLCGETAAGNFPAESTAVMRRAIDCATVDGNNFLH